MSRRQDDRPSLLSSASASEQQAATEAEGAELAGRALDAQSMGQQLLRPGSAGSGGQGNPSGPVGRRRAKGDRPQSGSPGANRATPTRLQARQTTTDCQGHCLPDDKLRLRHTNSELGSPQPNKVQQQQQPQSPKRHQQVRPDQVETNSASTSNAIGRPRSATEITDHTNVASFASMGRTKTTRVRINSTSEQIQDPNWLIRMSEELEQSQHIRKNHLKYLHQKLKSTITGAGSGTSHSVLASPEALKLPCSLQATPVKMPVSILKQRNSSTPTKAQQQQRQDQPEQIRTPKRSPTLASAAQAIQARPPGASQRVARAANVKALRQSPGQSAGQVSPISPNLSVQQAAPGPELAPVHVMSEETSRIAPKPMPICADGQVKVSGWKRNNLLAKTLSHFDEIRGNQRPVFVPTKIKLPTEVASVAPQMGSLSPVAQRPAPQVRGQAGGSNKFADLVREAISKKSLLVPGETAQPILQAKRTSDGEAKGLAVSTSTLDGVKEFRPLSADGANQQSPSNQPIGSKQLRSSSACASAANGGAGQGQSRQQVIGSPNWRQGQSNPPAQNVTAQLMSQFLSASAQQSNQLPESGSSSTRDFKLQHKNNQVLQNLRRQSNELQASLKPALSDESPTSLKSSAKGQPTSPAHMKDWKRLTGKLALLTNSRSGSTKSAKNLQVTGLSGWANAPLRLTISNQESGAAYANQCEGLQRRGSSQQQLKVPGEASNELEPQPGRKLSSSSMVVQPVSRDHGTGNQGARSSHSAASSPLLRVNEPPNGRRSSDSEAHRAPASSSGSSSSASVHSGFRAPVVVHRNDLLQLLQVTSSGGSLNLLEGGTGANIGRSNESSERSSARSSPRDRHSLQLGESDLAKETGEKLKRDYVASNKQPAPLGSSNSLNRTTQSESADFATLSSPKELPAEEGALANVGGGPEVRVQGKGEPPIGEESRKGELAAEGEIEGATKTRSPITSGTDLSWVVKKTSKVAFFQQKLRKMRWMSKQQKSNAILAQQKAANINYGAKQEESEEALGSAREEGGSLGASENSEHLGAAGCLDRDVFMDPTLIGDAIEIFLRSTMQTKSASSSSAALEPASPLLADGHGLGGKVKTNSESKANTGGVDGEGSGRLIRARQEREEMGGDGLVS